MTENHENHPLKDHFLYQILNPRSICTFGANNNLLNTMGSMQLRNIIAGGFKGEIYPIHPKLDTIQGLKAYESVLDLPETPELAFIILPPKVVPEVMEECGEKGVKRMIITSGGFREVGPEGVELSQTIDEIAEKYAIRFIGPNCLGVYNGWYDPQNEDTHFNTMWIYNVPKRGNISVASQSGTVACHMYWHGNNMGVDIGKSISVGNESNTDIVDFLRFFKEDPETSVIGLYIEEVKRGREFIKLAKQITPKKPIVAIYAGGTEAAERSIMSHTGSIGGNQQIYDAVFKETGIIATDYIRDFLYYLRTLSFSTIDKVYPKGKRIGIITDSGGAGSMMTKNCEKQGLKVPEFSPDLQEKINSLIPYTASPINPVDLTFDMNQYNLYVNLPKVLAKSGEVDGIIVYGIFDFHEVFETMKESGEDVSEAQSMLGILDRVFLKPMKRYSRKKSFPVFFVGPQLYSYSWYQKILDFNMNIFDFWDYPTKCMSVLVKYAEYRRNHSLKEE